MAASRAAASRAAALLVVLHATGCAAHGYLTCPLPRQYRDVRPETWTNWIGTTVPGDGAYNPGEGNAPNLNGAIGGGGNNLNGAQPGSHGLCGGSVSTSPGLSTRDSSFMARPINDAELNPLYGATDPRATFVSGGTMDVTVRITAYHAGWFEFRLAVPADGGASLQTAITQDMLNAHVLEIDESTPDYPNILNYAGMHGYGGYSSEYKCKHTGGPCTDASNLATCTYPTYDTPYQGHVDSTSECAINPTGGACWKGNDPENSWPQGTCCNDGGPCSDPAANTDRYVMEFSGTDDPLSESRAFFEKEYPVVLKVPSGIACERCVLQWTYQTANSRGTYPETFWNCADVKIEAEGYSGETGCNVPGPPGGTGTTTGTTGTGTGTTTTTTTTTGGAGTNWCSTTWAEYGSGTAPCTRCAVDSDCPDGRQCWATTYCKDGVLCGDADDTDCQDSTPDTCAPDEGWACTDAMLDDADSCAAFETACTAFCGVCAGVAERTTTTCAEPATGGSFPEGTVLSTCTCNCDGNADCVAVEPQQCAWSLPDPPHSPPPPTPPKVPPGTPSAPPPWPHPPPPPSPPLLPVGELVNIIGYWGNSGAAEGRMPRIPEIDGNYNVIILTFANLNDGGDMEFEMNPTKACCEAGAAYQSRDDLKTDLAAWKAAADGWGRPRSVLISIGGEKGYWPADSACDEDCIMSGLQDFFDEYHCDGLDVDLEGSYVSSASSLVPVIERLRADDHIVSAAPEAAQGPLTAYADIIPLLDYLTPQFYNNPPNAVTTPFIPTDSARWAQPWLVGTWETESQGEAYWYAVLSTTCAYYELDSPRQQGMLIPATPSAAGNNNIWDIPKLKLAVQASGVKHVGTWAFAYDWENDWEFAKTIGELNGDSGAASPPPAPVPPMLPTPASLPCASWCATNTDDWATKCGWTGSCAGCADCMSPPPPSPPPPNPTFGEVPSPPPSPPSPPTVAPPTATPGCQTDDSTVMCGDCPCSNCEANAVYGADPTWGYDAFCEAPSRGCPALFCDCTCAPGYDSTSALEQDPDDDDEDLGLQSAAVIAVSVCLSLGVLILGFCIGSRAVRGFARVPGAPPKSKSAVEVPTMTGGPPPPKRGALEANQA